MHGNAMFFGANESMNRPSEPPTRDDRDSAESKFTREASLVSSPTVGQYYKRGTTAGSYKREFAKCSLDGGFWIQSLARKLGTIEKGYPKKHGDYDT